MISNSGTRQHSWLKNGPLDTVFPVNKGDFHCYVSLPEGSGPKGSPKGTMLVMLGHFLGHTSRCFLLNPKETPTNSQESPGSGG